MDKEVLTDQSGQTRGFLSCFKKSSFRAPVLTDHINAPPLPAAIKEEEETDSSFPEGHICRRFSIAEIRSVTKDFNKRLLIGKGGFGYVYKATLNIGTRTTVAIKRRRSDSTQGYINFQAEVEIIPMLRHPNIVCLIGYCNDRKEMILVYEYKSNGTLGHHLHKHKTPLSWLQRLKICIGVARGLDYLHNGTSGQVVIHRDIKSSTILLDDQWTPKITDFGLSKTISRDYSSGPVITGVAGTKGYTDPEYMKTGRLSMKSDVYSFGVVLLEVLCRRRAWDMMSDEWELVRWAEKSFREGKPEQIIDPDLKGHISFKCLNDYVRLVKCCLRERQQNRITMAEVVVGLESILVLQERSHYSVTQTGITTSDSRFQKYFYYSGQNSAQAPSGSNTKPPTGKNYSLRGIKLLSVESYQPNEDLGHISDLTSEMDSISEISYMLDGSTTLSDTDEEFVSRNQTDSLYGMMQLDYIQQADMLIRMKDFLHLIWFYPMKKEADINIGSLVDKFSSLNNYIRKSQDSSTDGYYLMEIQMLLLDVEKLLDDAAFDMVAYLPEGLIHILLGEVYSTNFWLDVAEIHASTVFSARDRSLRCIKDLKVKILGISGIDAHEVAETLKALPELKKCV